MLPVQVFVAQVRRASWPKMIDAASRAELLLESASGTLCRLNSCWSITQAAAGRTPCSTEVVCWDNRLAEIDQIYTFAL